MMTFIRGWLTGQHFKDHEKRGQEKWRNLHLHLSCKYLQSPLTITILLAEEKKEMIGKLEISDRKDGKYERLQTAFSALPSRPNRLR